MMITPSVLKTDNHITQWTDWKWQDRHAIQSMESLSSVIELSSKERAYITKVSKTCPMKITPYYLQLVDNENPNCPIRKMTVPDERELLVLPNELKDPIGDASGHNRQALSSLVHRYTDRVLLFPTRRCGSFCRHCFRKWRRTELPSNSEARTLAPAFSYIENCPSIKEVILSGGDPLMLEDDVLLSILSRLKEIPHIKVIRIHSRMPVVNPFRITNRLAKELSRFRPLWLVTHINHPREVTPSVREHLALLAKQGIPLLNQSVLLRGVNADVHSLQDLSWQLIEAGIQPYYLHHLDMAQGLSHFRVSLDEGMQLMRELQKDLPGYAIPKYMLDIPGGQGKVPVQYPYVINEADKTKVESKPGIYINYPDK